jgi:hypothetical protein
MMGEGNQTRALDPGTVSLPDGDYLLTENAAWIEISGFAVRIFAGDQGLSVNVYASGREMDEAIIETRALYSELEEHLDD